MKIVFTGGGSGGHLMPLISVIREIKKLHPENNLIIYYLGPKDNFADMLFLREGVIIKHIISGKLRRYFSFKNIIDIFFKVPLGFLQSFFWLLIINPKIIFSKGGAGSYVVCLAGNILNIPVFLHESDSVPGLSNKKVAKWARKMFTAFPKTEYLDEIGALAVGNPIRQELFNGDILEAKSFFKITSDKPVLLISGGSQGAEAINDFIISIIVDLLKNYEVLHISGTKNYRKALLDSKLILGFDQNLKNYYHLYDSLNELQLKYAYSLANLIVSRAGASGIFEIATLGKPSILIPLPTSAGDHQAKNAYQYFKTGGTVVMEQKNLTPNLFLEKIHYLLTQSEKIKPLAQSFAKPDAGKKIAKEILEFLE